MLFLPWKHCSYSSSVSLQSKVCVRGGGWGMSSLTGQEGRQMIGFSVIVDCSGKFPSGNGDLLSGSSLFWLSHASGVQVAWLQLFTSSGVFPSPTQTSSFVVRKALTSPWCLPLIKDSPCFTSAPYFFPPSFQPGFRAHWSLGSALNVCLSQAAFPHL